MLQQKKRTTCCGVTTMDPMEGVGLFFFCYLHTDVADEHGFLPLVFAEGFMVICFQQMYWQYPQRTHEGTAATARTAHKK